MESLIYFFVYQWQRKLLALIIALSVWFFVSHSITAIKTIPAVPIRVINLPTDKTIPGLMPNGFLSKRMTLTLTGTKDVVEQLEPGDLEILLDVSNSPRESLMQITKKNLISLNPDINLSRHITNITHPEYFLRMSQLLVEKIPVIIHHPIGNPPEGYEFLDIWPIKLSQTVSGPQDLVLALKNKGLELTFNLDHITKEELDIIKTHHHDIYDDEIGFPVPDSWKKIVIPLAINITEQLNDPEAKHLHVNFLRKSFIPIKGDIVSLNVFYPLKYSALINPTTHALAANSFVQYEHDIPILKFPLYGYNVSKLFLDIVKGSLQLDIVAAPKLERETLEWSIDIVNHPHLEDTYVAFLLSSTKAHSGPRSLEREEHYRARFRTYMQDFALYTANQQPLVLDSTLEEKQITIKVPHTSLLPPKSP
ncbi:MAG: hypothetical protein H0W88_03815 [Parachlamydiaceae bacterium]|nr:hypothetical protein [Parachlamydiaceae bacterium]